MPSQSLGYEDKQPSKRVIYHCIILKKEHLQRASTAQTHTMISRYPFTSLLHLSVFRKK